MGPISILARRLGASTRRAGRPDHPPGDISESRTIALDASAASAFEALCRLDLTDSAMRLLLALGVAGRAALLPSVLLSGQGAAQRLGFVWRVDGASAERILLEGEPTV